MGPHEPINQPQIYFCVICGGAGGTRHHLIPRYVAKKLCLGGVQAVIRLCHSCHDDVHLYFSLWELGTQFNTVEKLKAELQRRKEWPILVL